ncbi:MAG: DUF1311 domain-containing protein [Lachnospiraceae bacterium]|nr:DUF1311 domain-containing protein [Lachnospiraceae bacterium]
MYEESYERVVYMFMRDQRRMTKMKKMNSKLAIMVAAAALCLSGCGAEPTIPTENSTIEESVSEMATVESEMATVESEMATVESESANVQIDYDVQKVLEEAEQEATALQKKLQEDPSLTQADMNMLSMEIYQVWDDVLNDLWKNLKVILDEDTMSDLLVEQRAWIAEKEAEVKQAGEEVGGGSLAPLVANQKAAELTRTRVYELASYLGF